MSENPQEKIERTEDNSILVKDLIIAVAKTDSGPAIMSNFSSRQEMVNMMVNLNLEISGKIVAYDMAQRKKDVQIIHPPEHGIMTFARKVFKR